MTESAAAATPEGAAAVPESAAPAVENVVSSERLYAGGYAILVLAVCAVLPARTGPVVAVIAVLLAMATVAAVALGVAAAIRTAVFADALVVCFAAGALADWPPALTVVLACVVPVTLLAFLDRAPTLTPALPWFTAGRVTRGVLLLGLAAVVVSAVVLTVWALAARPALSPYLRELHRVPWWQSLLGVMAFALVNPVWEEMLFRGVLLTEMSTAWGERGALLIQAVLFGAAHYAGFPSGVLGMLMAASFGLVLGVIRLRTGGLLVPYAVHVTANLTIGVLALSLF